MKKSPGLSHGLSKAQLKAAKVCEKTCSCSAWQDVFEAHLAASKQKIPNSQTSALELVKKKAKEVTAADTAKCAKTQLSLCSTPAFRAIRKQADENK
jgi:hypothetical protein